jgi:hypothetical protein
MTVAEVRTLFTWGSARATTTLAPLQRPGARPGAGEGQRSSWGVVERTPYQRTFVGPPRRASAPPPHRTPYWSRAMTHAPDDQSTPGSLPPLGARRPISAPAGSADFGDPRCSARRVRSGARPVHTGLAGSVIKTPVFLFLVCFSHLCQARGSFIHLLIPQPCTLLS